MQRYEDFLNLPNVLLFFNKNFPCVYITNPGEIHACADRELISMKLIFMEEILDNFQSETLKTEKIRDVYIKIILLRLKIIAVARS